MRVLVTGITGFIGGALVPLLGERGHEVRGFARDRGRVAPGVEAVEGDALTGRGLAEALDGVDAAYYLIHSMEPVSGGGDTFADRDRRAAERFAEAAERAGVGRVIYLGGMLPTGAARAHLASRLEVEHTLLQVGSDSVALRASIVIGAAGSSFRLLVRLVERLPVLALPGWHAHRTQPVDERDILAGLVGALELPAGAPRSLDVAGPDIVSYGEMVEAIRDTMLVHRPSLRLRLTVTPIASRVAAVLAGESHELVGPLMDGLAADVLPRSPGGAAESATLLGIRRHRFAAAVEHALGRWEATESLRAR